MKVKRTISFFLLIILTILTLASCGSGTKKTDEKLKIVVTIFPEYDWVRQITGENNDGVELKMLLDNGVDLHSYQPTADDIIKISTCDIFIHVGGESDKWVKDALKQATNNEMTVISLIDVLGDMAKEEETAEGMEPEVDEDKEDEEEEEEEEEEEKEYDEHVWLSLKNAVFLCERIKDEIIKKDEKNKEIYENNTNAYTERLKELDNKYVEAVNSAKYDTLVFGDRFPFRYLTDDYGIKYYAAFSGCSAETEASFKTIVFLAGKIDELGLKAVMRIETSDGKIASSIANATGTKDQKVYVLDSLQSVTLKDAKEKTYISIMENNLEVLKKALN